MTSSVVDYLFSRKRIYDKFTMELHNERPQHCALTLYSCDTLNCARVS